MPAEPIASPITIDIVSDVVCPWCYVGKRRLETALSRRPGLDVTVRWHPFQLDPTIPPGGLDRASTMLKKFGSADRIAEIHARLEAAGEAEGISFAFAKIRRSVNTLDAHRVLLWAAQSAVQAAVKEALMHAYFCEGRDIGEQAVLASIAGAAGLDRRQVAADLGTDRDVAAVQAEIGQAVRIGVSGVPFFIIDQRFAVPGAQSADILVGALDKAVEERRGPEPMVVRA